MMSGQLLKVRVCHGEGIVNAGLSAMLATSPGIFLASDADCKVNTADVIVTDYADALARMAAEVNDESHAGQLRSLKLKSERVMIVSQRELEWDVRIALSAGVNGYVSQRCGKEELLAAVHALGAGLRYFNEELLARAKQDIPLEKLTPRESDVLRSLAKGYGNKLIARELNISVGTVKTHIKAVFDKLGATARTHAVVLATRRGMISP